MGTECQLPCSDEDDKMLDEAKERGVQDWSPENYVKVMSGVREAITEKENIIQERIEKVTSLMEAEPVKDVLLVHDSPIDSSGEPNSEEISELRERILASDPRSAIIPLGERELPSLFTSGFKDVGEDLSAQLKDYPKDFARVRIYSAIQPTIENLGRMLEKNNPYSAWGVKVNFHHFEQKLTPLMVIEEKIHREEKKALHQAKEPLGKEDRRKYEKQERPYILQKTAQEYLGKYVECKEIREVLIVKAHEAQKEREKNKRG